MAATAPDKGATAAGQQNRRKSAKSKKDEKPATGPESGTQGAVGRTSEGVIKEG